MVTELVRRRWIQRGAFQHGVVGGQGGAIVTRQREVTALGTEVVQRHVRHVHRDGHRQLRALQELHGVEVKDLGEGHQRFEARPRAFPPPQRAP